jgi:hypothetical protein
MSKQPWQQRVKRILAYDFTGQYSYESCDIPTRARIDALLPKLARVFETVAYTGLEG